MDEHRNPQTNAPDEGELLAAYLDAETDEITSARLDRQLQHDPQAVARLDAMARARARLQRLDDLEPPEGFRERLDARLRAERSDVRPAPAARQADRRDRPAHRWFTPLAAAAALILVTVIGGAALLGQTGSSEDSAAAPAELQADAPADGGRAPLAAPPQPADNAEEDAAEAEAGADEDGEAAAGQGRVATVPQVTRDVDVAARLGRAAQATDDPVAREIELRGRAGLPAAPVCFGDVDATAVDLVEVDGDLVLAALVADRDEQQVVIFDPHACERLRTFAP